MPPPPLNTPLTVDADATQLDSFVASASAVCIEHKVAPDKLPTVVRKIERRREIITEQR